MKFNKITLLGILFILIAVIISFTDILTPFIRPITYIFLMGSSKGKDEMFFGLMGLFLLLSQLNNIFKKDIDETKYLKISIAVGVVLLLSGILLEIIFRYQLGIGMATTFISMKGSMTSTSIIHSHLLKGIIGHIIVEIMGPIIPSGINTGASIYSYLPSASRIIVLLIPILFIFEVLAIQNRPAPTLIALAFSSSCLIIGSFDGGLFGAPAAFGIFGLITVLRNGYYINHVSGEILHDEKIIEEAEKIQPTYRNKGYSFKRFCFNRSLAYLIIILYIIIRTSIGIAGADPTHYTVEVINPEDNIDFNDIGVKKVNETTNKTTYWVDPDYNELDLINDLKISLKDKCDYYTVSWNIYSFFE